MNRICFVHVLKCGGTSIASALRGALPLFDRWRGDRVVAINSQVSARTAQALGVDIMDYRLGLASYFLSFDGVRLLSGHLPCPPQLLDRFGEAVRFITVLRDPVERWISQYLYARHKSGGHFQTTLTAEEYLVSEWGRASGHVYATYFASRGTAPGPGAVAEARRTLDRLPIVAVIEDLRTLTVPFRRQFGRTLALRRERVSPAPEDARRILESEALRRDIRAACAVDIEIYQHARELALRQI